MDDRIHAIRRQVGLWIRQRRDQLHLSATETAREADINRVTLSSAESGERMPNTRSIAALERVLHWPGGSLERAYKLGERPEPVADDSVEDPDLAASRNPDGTLNGLAILIRGRLRELAELRDEPQMSFAELARKSGINAKTVHLYASGRITGDRLTDSVVDKLTRLAQALELPPEILLATARDKRYSKRQDLLRVWDQIPDEFQDEALVFLKTFSRVRKPASAAQT